MAFCGNGFDWSRDELEDFVAFYSSGRHRSDDTFADIEAHAIREKGVTLARTISQFAYLERAAVAIEPSEWSWHVRAPEEPRAP